MKNKQNFNKDEITLEFLETKLHSLGEPKAPVTLKERLIADIPQKQKRCSFVFSLRQKFGMWGLSASAGIAAVLVLIILNIGPSSSSPGSHNNINNYPNNMIQIEPSLPLAGSNDVWNAFPNDLNIPFIEDINLAARYKQHWNVEMAGFMISK